MDNHVHITVVAAAKAVLPRAHPEIQLSSITTSGVTTVFGLLGTDGTTRLMNPFRQSLCTGRRGHHDLYLPGAYQVPTPTLTGCIRDDIILIFIK